MTADLKAHADRLRELHHADEMLVLPNVWDAASAKIVAEAGFPVVATASAAISAMLGYPDGEGAPWQEMFAAAGVARVVLVPVTVDPEAGYGMEPRELVDRLLEIGAVGCNLEDTDHRAGGLVDAGAHGERLAAIRAAAGEAGSRSSSTRAPSARRSSTTAESADKSASRPVSSSHANVSRGDGIVNAPCSRRHRCGPP
jgi:2-methylisocitrate lyase-like PEP mutase family enzyme